MASLTNLLILPFFILFIVDSNANPLSKNYSSSIFFLAERCLTIDSFKLLLLLFGLKAELPKCYFDEFFCLDFRDKTWFDCYLRNATASALERISLSFFVYSNSFLTLLWTYYLLISIFLSFYIAFWKTNSYFYICFCCDRYLCSFLLIYVVPVELILCLSIV